MSLAYKFGKFRKIRRFTENVASLKIKMGTVFFLIFKDNMILEKM